MEHDFKAALDRITGLRGRTWHNSTEACEAYEMFVSDFEEELIRALKLADKIMQEPSEGMVEAASSTNGWRGDYYKQEFKAMRDQAIKEINDGK